MDSNLPLIYCKPWLTMSINVLYFDINIPNSDFLVSFANHSIRRKYEKLGHTLAITVPGFIPLGSYVLEIRNCHLYFFLKFLSFFSLQHPPKILTDINDIQNLFENTHDEDFH